MEMEEAFDVGDDGSESEEESDDVDIYGDIYGDLESDIFAAPPPTKKQKLEDDEIINDERFKGLLKENQELRALVRKLERENRNYSINTKTLHSTARNEIDKKNFIIKNLSDKLGNVTKSKSRLSNEEAEEIIKTCQEALHESQYEITLEEIQKTLKTINKEQTERIRKKRRRKHIKFGNMSIYFFTEDASLQREEEVIFPHPDKAAAKTGVEENCETNKDTNKNDAETSDKSSNSFQQFTNNKNTPSLSALPEDKSNRSGSPSSHRRKSNDRHKERNRKESFNQNETDESKTRSRSKERDRRSAKYQHNHHKRNDRLSPERYSSNRRGDDHSGSRRNNDKDLAHISSKDKVKSSRREGIYRGGDKNDDINDSRRNSKSSSTQSSSNSKYYNDEDPSSRHSKVRNKR